MLCSPIAALEPISDQLVAVVEKKAITEQDVLKRFELYAQLGSDKSQGEYTQIRNSLIDELCLEEIESLFWQENSLPEISISDEQIALIRANYPDMDCDDRILKAAYLASMRRDRIKRIFVQHHVPISSQELKTATAQAGFWQSLQAQWSFDLAYSQKPFKNSADAESKAKRLILPVGHIATAIVKNVDWSKRNQWQYFEDDGEFVAVKLSEIKLPNLLSHTYRVELCAVSPKELDLSTQKTFKSFDALSETYGKTFIEISSLNEVPPELWAAVNQLNPGEISQPFAINDQYYVARLIDCSQTLSNERIQAALTDALRQYRAEEKLPLWYQEMKQRYFVKVFA